MSFNNSKTIMYFTANNLITKKRGFGKEIVKLKLYSAKLINNKWTEIKELPFNSEKYSIGHPSLSLDEKKLYFISDMPGGYGLTDIYNVDILPDGSYSSPVNLGEKINTAGKEMFPFVDENNILYYSSNGIDKNVGDLDIYYTDLKNESTKVFNAGLPINSKSDDFAFFKIRGREKGYFSSNRIGGKGDDDIYLYSGDFKEKEICKEFINIAIKDSKTFKLLDSVSVLLRPIASKIQVEKNTKLNGRVKFEKSCVSDSLKISALKKGYLPFNKSFKSQKGKLNYELLLEKDILSEKIVEVVDRKVQIIIDDVYFSYGKFNISSQSKLKLAKLIAIMNKYPEIKIKVNSHTDSRSGYLFNLKLSKKRALSIRNYIISKGISKNRVYFEGYGEQKIINKCFNNVKCSEEEHLVNRRTTFLIVD